MKQTAIEWLYDQITNGTISAREAIQQAKAMEIAEKDKQYQRGFKDGQKHIKYIYNL